MPLTFGGIGLHKRVLTACTGFELWFQKAGIAWSPVRCLTLGHRTAEPNSRPGRAANAGELQASDCSVGQPPSEETTGRCQGKVLKLDSNSPKIARLDLPKPIAVLASQPPKLAQHGQLIQRFP